MLNDKQFGARPRGLNDMKARTLRRASDGERIKHNVATVLEKALNERTKIREGFLHRELESLASSAFRPILVHASLSGPGRTLVS